MSIHDLRRLRIASGVAAALFLASPVLPGAALADSSISTTLDESLAAMLPN